MVGALLSGIARRSLPVADRRCSSLAGFVLGDGGLGVLEFDPRSGFVHDLAIVALIVILFRDGLEVEAEMLQKAWRLPLRKLVLAMPITGGDRRARRARADRPRLDRVLPARRAAVADRPGALVVSVVTNPRVPRVVRHSLNLESGLNDGLALPAVLAFTAALSARATRRASSGGSSCSRT